MSSIFELRNVSKKFGKTLALDDVSLSASGPSILGLVGKNGSGKTTLLRHITGLYLPSSGQCETFGVATDKLGADEYSRIGAVQQRDTFLEWMRIRQLLGYISHFYDRWDKDLEQHLIQLLELDDSARVGTLSPGTKQKLALVAASCHHPKLLLLDEPLSDLDPLAREDVLNSLLERFRNDDVTILISSHMLPELERIADRIVFLDRGRIIADADLDDLKERYAEWIVTSSAGNLPQNFKEDFVISTEGDRNIARLLVSDAPGRAAQFASTYQVQVDPKPLNLEKIFGVLAGQRAASRDIDKVVVETR